MSRSSFSVSAEMREAEEKAVGLAEGLKSPACIKFLQPSQISGGFWMVGGCVSSGMKLGTNERVYRHVYTLTQNMLTCLNMQTQKPMVY